MERSIIFTEQNDQRRCKHSISNTFGPKSSLWPKWLILTNRFDRGLFLRTRFIYVSWSTSELRVRLVPLNRFKPSSKIFYWPFQGGTSFVDLLCFCSVLCLLCFVRVCLYVLRGHLLGKGWPLGSRLWCLLWVCHFPIGILGQVWYLIVSIPDLCNLTYFYNYKIIDIMFFSCMNWLVIRFLFCMN